MKEWELHVQEDRRYWQKHHGSVIEPQEEKEIHVEEDQHHNWQYHGNGTESVNNGNIGL